jgi:CRP-like cAMP-binding protein
LGTFLYVFTCTHFATNQNLITYRTRILYALQFQCIGDQIPFFRSLHHEHQKLAFYKTARLRTLDKDERLFYQGDKADSMYVILSGAVNILVKATATTTSLDDLKQLSKNARRWVASATEIEHNEYIVAGLGPTASFGELGIDREDSRRTASVIAVEPCVMMRISANAYKACKSDMIHDRLEMVTGILRNVHYLSHITVEELETIAKVCDLREYNENTVIFKEGSEIKHVAICYSGELRVIKKAKSKQTGKTIFLEVKELTHYDTFGNHHLVHNILEARLHHDSIVPVHHEWGVDDITHDMSLCVKQGVVKAKVLLILLNDFIRLIMHNGESRRKMVNEYQQSEKTELEVQYDLLMNKKLNLEHDAIVTATSPKYTKRRVMANVGYDEGEFHTRFVEKWEKSKDFEKTLFKNVVLGESSKGTMNISTSSSNNGCKIQTKSSIIGKK